MEPELERFLNFVLRNLIDFPDELVITREDAPGRALFRVQVRQTDIGKVVGKQGTTIAAIRNLLGVAAAKIGLKANVEILDERNAHAE